MRSRVGAITVCVFCAGAATPVGSALCVTCDGTNVASNVGGKCTAPSVSTVRDDSGAWLLEKNAVVRARLTAMLSSSVMFGEAVLPIPRMSPVRSTTATFRNALSVALSARLMISATSAADSGVAGPPDAKPTSAAVCLPLHELKPTVATPRMQAIAPMARLPRSAIRCVRFGR